MKRILVFIGALLIVCSGLCADLLTAYKKGEIKLVPYPNFGTKTEWDMLFRAEQDKSLTFLPDGSFFRTASKDGKVHKFNDKGEKIAEFGRKGQGPGDFQNPLGVDILDAKYVVVNDSGNQRISIFDLGGKYVNAVKADYKIFCLVALQDNKIALVAQDQKSTFWVKQYRVLIKDLETGGEKEVATFTDEKPQSPIIIKLDQFDGTVHFARIGKDKFLAAYSKSPEVTLYSLSGNKLSSFNVGIEREKISWDHLVYVMQPEAMSKTEREGYEKVIVSNKDRIRLPEYHQYYLGLMVDSESHILLYLNGLAKKTRDVAFQVYSVAGELLATTKVNQAEYKAVNPYSMCFHKNFVFTTLEKKDAEGSQFLARIKIAD
jgi:WD40 repeat protein